MYHLIGTNGNSAEAEVIRCNFLWLALVFAALWLLTLVAAWTLRGRASPPLVHLYVESNRALR